MQVVYVIYSQTHNAVKIGYASDLSARFSTLQIATPEPLQLMMVLIGGKELETRLHKTLQYYRIRGEWFSWSDIVAKALRAEQEEYLLSVARTKLFSDTNPSEKVIQSKSEYILSKAEYLLLLTRKKKVTIPEIKKSILPYVIETKEIKQILLDAGWITIQQGTCKTLFFTQPAFVE